MVTKQKVPVTFTADEPWTEVRLADGSHIRLRTVVKDVQRLEGEFTDEGTPLYYISTQQVYHTIAPEHMMRGARTTGSIN